MLQAKIRVCFSLFYVNDIGSTGSRGRTWGFPVFTLRLNSDAGYAVVPHAVTGTTAQDYRYPCRASKFVTKSLPCAHAMPRFPILRCPCNKKDGKTLNDMQRLLPAFTTFPQT